MLRFRVNVWLRATMARAARYSLFVMTFSCIRRITRTASGATSPAVSLPGRRGGRITHFSRLAVVAGIVAVFGFSGRAQAAPTRQASMYFQARDRGQLVEGAVPFDALSQPQRYQSKLFEVRGPITGVLGSDSQTLLLIGPNGSPTATVAVTEDRRLRHEGILDVGHTVRALCRVVPSSDGSSANALELVVAVHEHEAVDVDEDRARVAAEKARKEAALKSRQNRTPQRLASRGVYTNFNYPRGRTLTETELLEVYSGAVRHFNGRLSQSDANRIASIIIGYSRRYGLDARLVMAVIAVESNFNPNAVSRVGARGLGQLMPGTANDLGVANSFDPVQNLEGSTRLLKTHLVNMTSAGKPSEEALKLALACYNAGAGAVKKYQGVPPYRETQQYVVKITRLYRQFCGLSAE